VCIERKVPSHSAIISRSLEACGGIRAGVRRDVES
jgi:hypothetical protein